MQKYIGRGDDEGAMLLVGSGSSFRQSLRSDLVLDSEWWKALKYQKFEDEGAEELSMVTDIFTAYRWVSDYRPPKLPNNELQPAECSYIVNCQENGFPAPDFECHCHEGSNNIIYSNEHEHREYTVLASKVMAKDYKLGAFGRWASALKAYLHLSSC